MADPEIIVAIEQSLLDFQTRRLDGLQNVAARTLLKNKNPFLFAATGVESVEALANRLLDAFLSSSEETIMGNAFFEPIARAACQGTKSSAEGVDIEVVVNGVHRAIAVKSGTKVFNAPSKEKQDDNFRAVLHRHRGTGVLVECIVGHAYGCTRFRPSKKYVFKQMAGRVFWTYMTGDDTFHYFLFDRIRSGHEQYASQYEEAKEETLVRLTDEIRLELGTEDGSVNWEAFIRLNSG